MDDVICLPLYGKKKEPMNVQELYDISKKYYDNPDMDNYKKIYGKRTEYAWILDEQKIDFDQNYVRETVIENIVKGIMFVETEKGTLPVGHYTYVIHDSNIAYLDFITSFLLQRGILTKLMPRIIQEMKEKGVKTIKAVPYTKNNLEVFQKKFRFKKSGQFMIKEI
ncbi:MAG: hypothetical protein GON13_01240 [Nanoarchaeota archaeon]|nr:hypothetical protein [Nanoarchaeota archaeon]